VAAAALFAGRWVICTTWRGEAPSYLSFSSSALQMRRHIVTLAYGANRFCIYA
jgi:hypothetical protein